MIRQHWSEKTNTGYIVELIFLFVKRSFATFSDSKRGIMSVCAHNVRLKENPTLALQSAYRRLPSEARK
jgi:hypothetical protein